MAAHMSGPSCFFNFSSGSNGSLHQGSASGWQQQQPSGIVCSASLGGGTAAGGAAAGSASGSSASFLRLPKNGYSFALWVRLEDGREAAEQLQLLVSASQARPASAAVGGNTGAAGGGGGSAAGLPPPEATSDQAVFALLHQQQPNSPQHRPHLPFQRAPHHQLLSGVALAVRRVESPGSPHGSSDAGHEGIQPAGQQRPALQLVAHCWAPKHAEAALPLQQPLVPGRWHHLAVTHSVGAAHAGCRHLPFHSRRSWLPA